MTGLVYAIAAISGAIGAAFLLYVRWQRDRERRERDRWYRESRPRQPLPPPQDRHLVGLATGWAFIGLCMFLLAYGPRLR